MHLVYLPDIMPSRFVAYLISALQSMLYVSYRLPFFSFVCKTPVQNPFYLVNKRGRMHLSDAEAGEYPLF